MRPLCRSINWRIREIGDGIDSIGILSAGIDSSGILSVVIDSSGILSVVIDSAGNETPLGSVAEVSGMKRESVAVAAVRDIGPDAIALHLETPSTFEASPGQFVKLVTTVDDEEESRFYTISSPNVEETFELTIEIDDDGEVSPRLAELNPGEEVVLSGPYGNAYYEDEDSVVILAGGPGIGPAIGIAERVLEEDGMAAVVYRDDVPIHVERLEHIQDSGGVVEILKPADPLAAAVQDLEISGEQVFVYGFVDFLDEAMDAIASAGGTPDTAKVENFG